MTSFSQVTYSTVRDCNLVFDVKASIVPLISIQFVTMMKIGTNIVFIIGLAALILGQIASAMSLPSNTESSCAVVGCGVLGTSLCKQLIESPEFSSWKGKAT